MYVETAPAVKPGLDTLTRTVLEMVNQLRMLVGKPPIDDLPCGGHYWRGPNQCPVARALDHDPLVLLAEKESVVVEWVARFDGGLYQRYCDHDHYHGENLSS